MSPDRYGHGIGSHPLRSAASISHDRHARASISTFTRARKRWRSGSRGLPKKWRRRLGRTLGPATGRVQVILVDQNDQSNGWATPLPYNTIEISAATPAADSGIGNVDDWLRLVFTHEYTHIVHLEPRPRLDRRTAPRVRAAAAPLSQPATCRSGRLKASRRGRNRRRQAEAGFLPETSVWFSSAPPRRNVRCRSIARAARSWAGRRAMRRTSTARISTSTSPDRYGAESLRRLTDETSRRLPYFGSRAFKKVFGDRSATSGGISRSQCAARRGRVRSEHSVSRAMASTSRARGSDETASCYSLPDAAPLSDAAASSIVALATITRGHDALSRQPHRPRWRRGDLRSDRSRPGCRRGSLTSMPWTRASRRHAAADPRRARGRSRRVAGWRGWCLHRCNTPDRRELATAPLATGAGVDPRRSQPDVDLRCAALVTRRPLHRRRAPQAPAEPSEIVVRRPATGRLRVVVPHGRNAGLPVWSAGRRHDIFRCGRREQPSRFSRSLLSER